MTIYKNVNKKKLQVLGQWLQVTIKLVCNVIYLLLSQHLIGRILFYKSIVFLPTLFDWQNF
jgi:hypothetical protein